MNDLLFLTAQLADAIHLLDCMANEVDKKRGIAILEEIHTRFLSELQSGGWISVADRLPEPAETVLVFMDNGVWSGFHDTENWFIHGWSKNPFKVSHWQPMPQPPKASE
ncbi:DUF551 domain-containing protein [Wielerella bovis]|uniref:DUF551 domain-containing protein n=1 Tax=Wielerella bovis TaxID=2917790 RepID=UPI0020190D39|nr:DUF551 domain-containing protein [Wielerella bovis]ULJ60823.1 DUF551 domain-containing protein [Wielerella bovis]